MTGEPTGLRVESSFAKWRKDPAYRKAYATLDEEFALAGALIDARTNANVSQEVIAERMKTSQTDVARLEGGHGNPSNRATSVCEVFMRSAITSCKMLRRHGQATGTKLKTSFEPN